MKTINPYKTFENFIVGDSNIFAFTALKTLATRLIKNEEVSLFVQIVSDKGMGRTHLLHAFANELSNHNIAAVLSCLSSIDIHSVSENILLFDDVDAFSSDEVEQFSKLLNSLHHFKKVVVFTSRSDLSKFIGHDILSIPISELDNELVEKLISNFRKRYQTNKALENKSFHSVLEIEQVFQLKAQ